VIDRSVYPDLQHGNDFEDDFDRADYVQRICAAGDFGVAPDRATVEMMRDWRGVFDAFPLLGSPTYHALRDYYRWPAMPIERSFYPPRWETLDRIEGRDDPCRDFI